MVGMPDYGEPASKLALMLNFHGLHNHIVGCPSDAIFYYSILIDI